MKPFRKFNLGLKDLLVKLFLKMRAEKTDMRSEA